MKIAASSGKPSKKVNCIIPLEDDEAHHKLSKENSVSWELRTVPADGASPTYKVLTRILSGEESVRQMLRWSKDLDRVCVGLNATDLTAMKPIMLACMRPRVDTLFEATLLAHVRGNAPRSCGNRLRSSLGNCPRGRSRIRSNDQR